MDRIIFNNLCFECGACLQSCKKQAISFQKDEEGFSYPVIDSNKCVNCGLCNKVCPSNHFAEVLQELGVVYAVQHKDSEILKDSSSGGVFSLIAEYVLSKGGIVYGATFDHNLRCHHDSIERLEDLHKLRGSKYVHSSTDNTFAEVLEHLKNGRWVYYTGSPCQIAGLRLFLRKEYDTLITSDIVCHGTPSQQMFDYFVQKVEEQENVRITNVNFRDKYVKGWAKSATADAVTMDGRKKFIWTNQILYAYLRAFNGGALMRKDCYDCPFKDSRRVSDITIADFWQVSRHYPSFDSSKGVSLMIINSDKGKKIWDEARFVTDYKLSSYDVVSKTPNSNLFRTSSMPSDRLESFNMAMNSLTAFVNKYAPRYTKKEIIKIHYKFIITHSKPFMFLKKLINK